MNKTYKYTLTAHEKKEISFDTGVSRLAVVNGDGVDGSTTVVMSEITKQHSGDIVSFLDGADAPFADFIVNIAAVQSGSGDPTPENIRPISGWTGAIINVSGEDTSNPTTYTISWQATAGTVYYGRLNVKTGELIVTHAFNDFSESEIYLSDDEYKIVRKRYIPGAINSMGGNNAKCDITNNFGNVSSSNYHSTKLQFSTSTNSYYYMSMPVDVDPATVNFVFELATPVTYHLTPVEIRSLLGLNNVWADCGPVDVRYFVQSTQPMIDYIDDKTIAYFDAEEDFSTGTISLVGATSTDVKNCLLANKNANIIIRVKRYSTILLYYLREYSPNYFADFASHANIFDAEGTKSMRIDYLRLDLTQETSDFTDDYIILPTS